MVGSIVPFLSKKSNKMATPFDGLVNLAPIDEGTTYLVNDLTGLSQEMVDSLTRSGDEEDLEILWTRIKNNAAERLMLDFEVQLAEKRDFRHELCETIPPKPDPLQSFVVHTGYNGAVFEMCYQKHTGVSLTQLVCWAQTSGIAQVVVYDQDTLTELWRKDDQAIVAGINRIPIVLATKIVDLSGLCLFVGLKTSAPMRPMWTNRGFSGAVCDVSAVYNASTNDALTEQSKTSGGQSPVHLDCKVVGDLVGMITQRKDKLASAFRYLCGHLLLKERLASDNFNAFTNTNQLKMEELRDDYHVQYKSHLTKAIKLIYTNLEGSEAIGTNPEHQGGAFVGSYV